MIGLIFYLFFFCVVCLSLRLIQKTTKTLTGKECLFSEKDILIYLFAISPLILIYGLRYGIGTDYYSYEKIYNTLHKSTLLNYFKQQKLNTTYYYVELGYFIICRFFASSYTNLNILIGLMLFTFVYFGIIKFNNSVVFGLFIYLSSNLFYSMNGVRFSIALTIVFCSYKYISEHKLVKWVIFCFIASLFHKTALICIPFYFLGEFKSKRSNKIRNILYFTFIFLFPLLINFLLSLVSIIPLFKRYFSVAKYALDSIHFDIGPFCLLAIKFLPLFVFKRNFLLKDNQGKLFFRIAIFQIPLQELGLMNIWLTRLARFPQSIEILLIPYFIKNIQNKTNKTILTVYYILFYTAYFCYYAITTKDNSIIYQSILFN